MKKLRLFIIMFNMVLVCSGCGNKNALGMVHNYDENIVHEVSVDAITNGSKDTYVEKEEYLDLNSIPEYNGNAFVILNDNVPRFRTEHLTTDSYEKYCELDSMGRCGVVEACVGKDIMPTEERGSIGMVKPSGWHTVKYDIVDGKYLYNICKEHCMFILHLA